MRIQQPESFHRLFSRRPRLYTGRVPQAHIHDAGTRQARGLVSLLLLPHERQHQCAQAIRVHGF